jgi:enoyl-[acyl-carrier-protein] reductase (NADH)
MGLFEGKKGLIFGLANKNSIAWGISRALHEEGAELGFSYAGEVLKKRVDPLAASIGSQFVEECDVTDDAAIESVFAKAGAHFGSIDLLVHSVAFAPREELSGRFVDTSREGFGIALDISCYSLIALANQARTIMPDGGSIIAMTYFGAEKVTPNYNLMGVAKAALEATVRYLAWDLGQGQYPRQRHQCRTDQDPGGIWRGRLPQEPQLRWRGRPIRQRHTGDGRRQRPFPVEQLGLRHHRTDPLCRWWIQHHGRAG